MRQKALIIGIDRYPYLGSLKSPAKDAEAIASLFQKSSSMPWEVQRWPPVLPNGTVNDDLVTEDGLSEVIRDLFCPKSGDYPDTALLFFSGHGHRNDQKEVFLATSDTNRQDQWGICLNKLHQLLPQSQVKRQIVWLDCCHAGELINFDWTEEECKKWLIGGDRFLVAACAAYNKGYAVDGHGLLTRALLEALNLQQEPEGKWITSWTVASFIRHCQDNRLRNQNPLVRHYGDEILFWQKANNAVNWNELPSKGNNLSNPVNLGITPPLEKKEEEKRYKAFLKIDYHTQNQLFNQFLLQQPRGCFLIKSREDWGPNFLLTRLMKQLYESINNKIMPQKLYSRS